MATQTVRVRFAPSPTGWLHVGGLRTALYNYLFARNAGGVTVLRIEDTDRTRYVEGAVENLVETLRWAGLEFDEGPVHGGAFGPYVQSERLDLYREHMQKLLDMGHAYPCFCTGEELDASRKSQVEQGLDPAYDRRCRNIPTDEAAARIAGGTPHTVRLKVPLVGEVRFSDVIRGDILVNCAVIDDQVLFKSDGFPTYHLANVVDDHHMRITHVIRGEEWLPSTSKHVLLYRFFGWDLPVFAHLPLLLNEDRSKLSKRQGDVAVEDYRRKGYLPEALLNFVALLGWNTSDDRELYSLDELVGEFSLDRVGKAGAVFDGNKLNWFNGQYLRALAPEQLARVCEPYMREAGIDTSDDELLTLTVSTLQKHLTLPSDIVDQLGPFLSDEVRPDSEEAAEVLRSDDSLTVLTAVAAEFAAAEIWDPVHIGAAIKLVQQSTGIKGKGLFMPIRIALTGALHGPELAGIACILGKTRTIERLDRAARTEIGQ